MDMDLVCKRRRVLSDYAKKKKIAANYYNCNEWEKALHTIFQASGFMYTLNQVLYDDELEVLLKNIAMKILPANKENSKNDKLILYFDSFGNMFRGLTRIYLEALVSLQYRVVYVTYQKYEQTLSKVEDTWGKIEKRFVVGKTYVEQMRNLSDIIESTCANSAFLYLTPDDVVAVGTFAFYEGVIRRYLINLTDHAFWLGKNACDVVINFREFGGKVARDERGIPEERLVYIPYYPDERNEIFEGFSFDTSSNYIIFSGGSLYKTISKDKKYYKFVDYIMHKFPDLNFIYLGNGDTRQMKKLVAKYRGRVCFSTERRDFYEVMKRCTLYLSTYPYNGGLMTQYALLARKVPVTLCNEKIEQELSINHHDMFWCFESEKRCVAEIEKLLYNECYRKQQEEKLGMFLINSDEFMDEMNFFLKQERSKRKINFEPANLQGFKDIPLENMTNFSYARLFFRKNGLFMFRHFPIKYILGMMEMLREKMYKK